MTTPDPDPDLVTEVDATAGTAGNRPGLARHPRLRWVAMMLAVSLAAAVGGYGAYRAGRAAYVERVRPHDYDPATLEVLVSFLNLYLSGAEERRSVYCSNEVALNGVRIPDNAHVDEVRNRVVVITYRGDVTVRDTMDVITANVSNVGARDRERLKQDGYVFEPGMVVYEEPPPFPSADECRPRENPPGV